MEAEEGIEPSNDGFANHCLTTWLLRHSHGTGASDYALAGRVSMPGCLENHVCHARTGDDRIIDPEALLLATTRYGRHNSLLMDRPSIGS